MLPDRSEGQPLEEVEQTNSGKGGWGLQAFLWSSWTLVVVATGYFDWRGDMVAQRPFSLIGLIVRCAVVGVIGLVVLTKIEMWLQPWKFMD